MGATDARTRNGAAHAALRTRHRIFLQLVKEDIREIIIEFIRREMAPGSIGAARGIETYLKTQGVAVVRSGRGYITVLTSERRCYMVDTCPGCANAVRPEDRFCSNCARPLAPSPQQNISSHIGDHNVGSFIGSTLQDSTIHFNEPQRGEPIAEIGRTQLKPLKLFGHPLKSTWLIFSGVMLFLAQLASISSGFFSGKLLAMTPFWFWIGMGFMFIGALCFGLGVQLKRFRFSALFGPYGLQAGADNSVHLVKIYGTCPLCSGELTLESVGPKEHKTMMVVCKRNRHQHMWRFDHTVLEDIA